MNVRVVARVFSLIVALILLAGCGGDGDSPRDRLERTAAANPERSSPSPTPGSDAPNAGPSAGAPPSSPPVLPGQESPAQSLRNKIDLPDTYPSDAPVYPGSSNSHYGLSEDGRSNSLFGTDDSVEQVSEYMVDFLQENGWDGGSVQEVPQGVQLTSQKGGREMVVIIREVGAGTPDAVTMIAVSVDRSR